MVAAAHRPGLGSAPGSMPRKSVFRFTVFASDAANRSPAPGPPDEPPSCLRNDDGVAGAERLFVPRYATGVKRFGSGAIGGGGDSPLTHRPTRLSTRLFTVARITSAAAVIVSTRADEPFYRGDEPERRPSHTVVASPRCADVPRTDIVKDEGPT